MFLCDKEGRRVRGKAIFGMMLILLLTDMLTLAISVVPASAQLPVHNFNTGLNYTTIQNAIDAPETLNGHTISVEEGIYYEHVVIHKSLLLIGENGSNTIIDGNKTGVVIHVTADNVTIKEFTVKNGNTGIYLDHSDNSRIMKNNVIFNVDAILVRLSDNCAIYRNLVGNNTHRGILVTISRNFTVSENHVYGYGWYGINVNASVNGLITQNNVHETHYAHMHPYDGIGILNSNNCIVARNNVYDNAIFGIWLDSSSDNFIYHNNFINNGFQAVSVLATNHWDNGVEGNYWSNYTGVDSNYDGIGDTQHIIDASNYDNHPLMGMFSSFNTSQGHHVNVISNSAIENFEYLKHNSTIKMHVSNMTREQTYGFCRIRIPHPLMSGPYNVTVDGANPIYWNYTTYDDGTNRWIYFSYQHSVLEVVIQGFPPSNAVPPTFPIWLVIATVILVGGGVALLVYFKVKHVAEDRLINNHLQTR